MTVNPFYQPIYGAKKRTIDAEEDLAATSDLTARNEASAMRQNAAARLPRQNPRAGGGRYTRRGMWTPNAGSGLLNQANAQAMSAARRKARYAQLDEEAATTPVTTTLGPVVAQRFY